MLNIKPHERTSNPGCSAPTADMTAAAQRVQFALGKAAQLFADLGGTDDLAEMFQEDALSAEVIFKGNLLGMGCDMLGKTFENMDKFGPSLDVEGKKYRKGALSNGHAMTSIGPVPFKRRRYPPASGSGKSFIPTEQQLGLTERGLTPAAASVAMALLSNVTARESEDLWKRLVGEGPSLCTLVKLASEAGRCLEECSTEVMDELREQEELPENAFLIHVGLDGVMMRMHAEKNGDEVIEEAGWREASCGVVTVRDDDENRLQSRYIGRLPEGKKGSLKSQIRKEVNHLRSQNPNLKLVVTADGAKDNWTFSESLKPDFEVLDFFHAAEYLKAAADAAYGSDTKASIKWFDGKRNTLRHDPNGVEIVIEALRYLLRKGRGRAKIRKALGYFRNNRRRMNYYHLALQGYPIGSGEVEAANKVLVTQRLKRAGQRWGRDGGQGVLSFRALIKSDRFDRAWRIVVPKMERSKKRWSPDKTAANINQQIRDAA